jgi:hypothetical protein
MPGHFSPRVADFISKLLEKTPELRLGGGGEDAEELKRHPFFSVSFFPHICYNTILYASVAVLNCLIHVTVLRKFKSTGLRLSILFLQ